MYRYLNQAFFDDTFNNVPFFPFVDKNKLYRISKRKVPNTANFDFYIYVPNLSASVRHFAGFIHYSSHIPLRNSETETIKQRKQRFTESQYLAASMVA